MYMAYLECPWRSFPYCLPFSRAIFQIWGTLHCPSASAELLVKCHWRSLDCWMHFDVQCFTLCYSRSTFFAHLVCRLRASCNSLLLHYWHICNISCLLVLLWVSDTPCLCSIWYRPVFVHVFVCLSVRPSHAGIVSKQLDWWSRK